MKKNFYLLLMFLLAGFTVQAGHLTQGLYFSAKLSGAQEVPPVTTNASGVAVMSLNETYDSLCVNIATTGLSGEITGLHIHEGAFGASGGVVIPFTSDVVGNKVNTKIPVSSLDMKKLMDGLYYVNVHTAANPGGEIRGQVYLERDYSHSAWLDESYVSSGASGYGLGQFTLSHDKRKLHVKVLVNGLTGNITVAHLHSVSTGGVVIGLDSLIVNGNEIVGTVDYSSFSPDSLNGGYYLNVHTAANPAGEVAGVTSFNQSRLTFDSRMDEAFSSTGSAGKGFGQFTLSPNMDTLYYDLVFDNLGSAFAAMHIHSVGGAVMHNMTADVSGNEAHGMWVSPPDSAIDMFLYGGAYVNVHSADIPSGEIAGNIVRFAREGYMVNIDGAQTVPNVSTMATGGGLVSINRERTSAHYMLAADNFTGTVAAAHFHNGATGASGGVEYTLPWMNGGAYGYWSDSSTVVFTSTQSTLFQNGMIYVNIHSDFATSGEARGQVLRGAPCFVSTITSAQEAQEQVSEISVYPNPTYGNLTIDMSSEVRIKGSMLIADLSGRTLSQQSIDLRRGVNQLKADVSDLPAGMYLLYITDQQNNRILARRVAKQ